MSSFRFSTVRDPTNEAKTQFLKDAAKNIGKADNLSFGSGDLSKSGSYEEAFAGCWGVLHSGAVLPTKGGKDPYENIVKPAIEGTKNVLDSVKANSETIQRLINISSVAAVAGPKDMISDTTTILTEDNWNTSSTVETDAYGYGRTQAEKMVFADEHLNQCVGTIASLNPGIVIGPCLSQSQAENSFVTIVLKGYPFLDVLICYVDVRDVAKAAVLAFTQNEQAVTGQRFILSSKVIKCMEFSKTVKNVYPPAKGYNTIGTEAITYTFKGLAWLVNKFPIFENFSFLSDAAGVVGLNYDYDTTKSKTVLGLGKYRDFEETCKDAAQSIAELISFQKK